ncbi:MAG: hypothetical protein U0163_21930 [Gemmatimonadaceae bacterium]
MQMHKHRILFAAAALAAATFAGRANAQDTTVSKGEVAKAPSFSSLLAAINATPTTLEAIKKHGPFKDSDVRLINAEPLMQGQNDAALKSAMETHAAHLEQLRTSFDAQPVILGALEKSTPKLTAADVIAADVHTDGSIDVYYRPKPM